VPNRSSRGPHFTTDRIASLLPWLEAAAIVVLQACLLRGFTNQLAVNPVDEARVLYQWPAILVGHWSEVNLAISPVVSTVYALLRAIIPSVQPLSDVVFVGCAIGSPLAVWWMLRAVAPFPAPWIAACVWATAEPVLHFEQLAVRPTTYLFSNVIYITALGFAFRGRRVWALSLGLIACANRAEFTPWLLLTVLMTAWLSWRRRRLSPAWIAAVVLTAGFFVFQQVHPSCRGRFWYSFQQHYGLGAAERLGWEDTSRGFHEGPAVTDANFPGVGSVVEAAKVNPREFLAHLLHNIALVPGAMSSVLLGITYPVSPTRWAFLLAVGLLACVGLWRGRRWLGVRLRRLPVEGRVASAISLYVMVVLLVVRPKESYLFPFLTLWLPLITLLAWAGWRSLGSIARSVRRWRVGVVLVVVVLVAAPFLPRRFPVIAGEHRGVRETLLALERFHVPRDARLLTFFGWAVVRYGDRDTNLVVNFEDYVLGISGSDSLQRLMGSGDLDYVLLPWLLVVKSGPLSGIVFSEVGRPQWELVGFTSRMMCYRRVQ